MMITIITPTYNRGYILKNAYDSLCSQTCFDFEWIVVDDGSSDNTEDLVNGWLKENKAFEIVYIKKNNGGKHRAVNLGVSIARYEFVLILDSDDFLSSDCVETAIQWIDEVKDDKYIAGVAGLKGWINKEDSIGGQKEDNTVIECTNLKRAKYGLKGDKAELYKTEIMKKYPFPEFEGEKFIRENSVWDLIAKDGLKIRWHNKVIYYAEYIEDGLTKGISDEIYINNFQGYTFCSKLEIETVGFPKNYLRTGRYIEVAKKAGKNRRFIKDTLRINNVKYLLSEFLYTIKKLIRGK